MKIYALLLLAFGLMFFGGCSSTPQQKVMKNKKIIDFEDYSDEKARRDYDILRVQVNNEQLLYRPIENAPAPQDGVQGRVMLRPNLGATPAYTINEEHTAAFAFGSDELSPAFKEELAEVAAQISTFQNVRVKVAGYTDSIGGDEYNFELSKRRAKAVAYFLAEHGVDPGIITYTGHGKNEPVASNSTEAGRAKNRRVEIFVFTAE